MVEPFLRRAVVLFLLAGAAVVLGLTIRGARLRDEVRPTNWIRRQIQPGGWKPRYSFLVTGRFAAPFDLALDRKKHRCRGLPEGVTISPAELGLRVGGVVPDRRDLGDLQDTLGVVSALLDQGGAEVLDEETGRRWPPAEWRAAFMEREGLTRADHIVVERAGAGLRSRGMRKFGRADLVIPEVPGERDEAAMRLLARLIDYGVDGGVLDVSREIALPDMPAGMRMVGHFAKEDEAASPVKNVWIEVTGFR